jgi:hypothetical protein
MDLVAPSKYPLALIFLRDESPDSLAEAFIALQTIILSLSFGAFRVSDLDLQNVSLAQNNCPVFTVPLFLFLVRLSSLRRNMKAANYFVCWISRLIRVRSTNVLTPILYTVFCWLGLDI